MRSTTGSDFNKKVPIVWHEHIFPDCNDPELILRSLNEIRPEWDTSLDIYDEMKQYRNNNT